jgi:hypothetical protein
MLKKVTVLVSMVALVALAVSPMLLAETSVQKFPREQAQAMKAAEQGDTAGAPAGGAFARLPQPKATPRAGGPRVVGTITYDTGTLNALPIIGSYTFGNQFDSALGGPVNASGSVTMLTFYLAGLSGTNAFITVYGPPSGTTASVLSSANVMGLALGTNTVNFATPVSYTGSSFLAGVWNLNTNPTAATNDAPGLDTGTIAGQGFHGMAINDIVGTDFQTFSANAMVSSTGDILVPVELMHFEIE